MNQEEFAFTLNNALTYIDMKATPAQLSTLFKEIDFEKTGWITYEIYFLFLRHYFGSFCPHPWPGEPEFEDPDQALKNAWMKLGLFDRFVRMIMDQLRDLFLRYDTNKNLHFEEDEIEAILAHVFGLNQS